MSKQTLNTRLYIVFLFFISIFSCLLARLIYVQVFQSRELKNIASEQHNLFIEVEPQRGVILDRNLKELAVNTIAYSIFATKQFVADEKTEEELATLLNLDIDYLKTKLNAHKSFVWLKRKVSPEISAQIKALNILGIGQIRESKRFYPNGPLACHIIGFTDIDNKGLEAIELFCDSYLSGLKGWRLAQRDAKRREVICWGYKSILPTDGYNPVLTIDSVIQNIAESQLRKAAIKYKAISATAIVMEPKTGEILALANYPDYDLNQFQDYPEQVRRNLAITDVFEPGSSFKFVTAAAALEERKVKPQDEFYCEKGNYRIGSRVLHDYRAYGTLSFKRIIEHSSNIGVVKIAQVLGEQVLYNYIKDFGFGSLTGIDLPGEVKGIARPPLEWSKFSISSIPIGQEIAVTPIQLILAISCVANDGILVKPKIIKSIQNKDNEIIKSFPVQEVYRVISPETASILKQILAGVVEKGTGTKAKVPGYSAAGKTGTAQKARPEGGYYTNKYCSTFVGFVPVKEPKISILVVLNEPHPAYFGGTVCAPVFSKIATETLKYLEMSSEISKLTKKP